MNWITENFSRSFCLFCLLPALLICGIGLVYAGVTGEPLWFIRSLFCGIGVGAITFCGLMIVVAINEKPPK